MAELRTVDPNTLVPNPNNPRRTAVPQAMDDQLIASITTVGIIQPPRVKEVNGELVIVAGNRRAKAAVAAGLTEIDVLVDDADETGDPMRSMSENLIRASMGSVDIWRATERLEAQGWNEAAIADALALPVKTVKRLKLLAHLHPPMLDFMASGSMPSEDHLRIIAAATRDEQTQVWKKHKPKKGHNVNWYEIARALAKRRIPATAAKFDDELAHAYGVVWEVDLFAPAGEDGRYTTNVDGFFGAQQEWLQNNLPDRGRLLPTDEHGRHQLPKKAEHVYGKPTARDHIGHYLDPQSGEVRTIAYRMPEPKHPAKLGKHAETADDAGDGLPTRTRAEITQMGCAMIGDLRTDALHQALREAEIDDGTLLALLVLAFAGRNVSVQSGAGAAAFARETAARALTEGGVLTSDPNAVRTAARSMLTIALSCRDNMSNSGTLAQVAGDTIGASLHLPNMATQAFLTCLSKAAVEKAAAAEGLRIEARAKDTRARLIERFKDGVYVYPGALFKLTPEDLAKAKAKQPRHYVPGTGWADTEDDTDSADPDAADEAADGRGLPDDDEGFDAGPWNNPDDVEAGAATTG